MNKSTWAKIAGWLGGLLIAVGGSGYLGPKYSPLALSVGAVLSGLGVHTASNTSAGHPNG